MKTAAVLSVFLAAYSLSGAAQEIDYDKRNAHIFCSSHLTVIRDSLDRQGDEYQTLTYLSGMHRQEAKALGATAQHFDDVARYLMQVRDNDKQQWNRLSAQSRKVCLVDS